MQSKERGQETTYIPFLCAAKAVGELVAMCFTSTSKRTGLVATLSCGRIICGLLYKVRALCSIWGQCNLEAGSVALTTLSDPSTVFHHFFCLTLPVIFLSTHSSIFHLAGTLSGVLVLLPTFSSPDFIICKLSMKITPAHPVAYCTHIFTNTRRQLGKAEQRKNFLKINWNSNLSNFI